MKRCFWSMAVSVLIVLAVWLQGCGGSGTGSPTASLSDTAREEPVANEDIQSEAIEPTRPGSLPPGIKETIFVRYGPGHPKWLPAHTGTCTQTSNDNQPTAYSLESWRLPAGGIGMTYKVNTATVPAGISSGFATSVAAGFQTWTNAGAPIISQSGTTTIKSSKLDGTNLIAFGRLQARVIAVTRVWFYTSGPNAGVAAEIDEIFSTGFAWSINGYSCTLGQNNCNDCGGTPNTMDVQNIHTHEAGHWIGLGHPPNDTSEDQTMHAYSTYTELKRRTLGTGDIAGATVKYPPPPPPPF